MMELFTYRVDIFAVQPVDVTGFDVEAMDGSIGKIDEASFEAGSSCLVVDTGFWIFGKKRMIPAGVVRKVDVDRQKVYVDLSKDDVRAAPDYDEARHASNPDDYHREQEGFWGGVGR